MIVSMPLALWRHDLTCSTLNLFLTIPKHLSASFVTDSIAPLQRSSASVDEVPFFATCNNAHPILITAVVDGMRSPHGHDGMVDIDVDVIAKIQKELLCPDCYDHWVCTNNGFVVVCSLKGANPVLAGSANITLVTMHTQNFSSGSNTNIPC